MEKSNYLNIQFLMNHRRDKIQNIKKYSNHSIQSLYKTNLIIILLSLVRYIIRCFKKFILFDHINTYYIILPYFIVIYEIIIPFKFVRRGQIHIIIIVF